MRLKFVLFYNSKKVVFILTSLIRDTHEESDSCKVLFEHTLV